jgi:Zn-dependent protease with chaperone function
MSQRTLRVRLDLSFAAAEPSDIVERPVSHAGAAMSFQPNALLFGSDLPGAGVPCRVAVDAVGLSLECSEGTAQTVAFAQLTLQAGGFDDDQLVVKWTTGEASRTLYLKDAVLIRRFRDTAPPELMGHLERTAERVRRGRISRRTVLLAAVGLLSAAGLGLWFGADALVALAVDRIPVEWERTIGESARGQFLAGQTIVAEGPAVAAVQEITTRLTDQVERNPYRFQITVVKSDTVNAFALPGGYVMVFTGLLKKAQSPEEVAGVLGHEVNHVLLRHGLNRMVKSMGVIAVVSILLGNQGGVIEVAKRLGIELVTLKFGREQESEADLGGLRLLHRAKIAPAGMIAFFERLSERDQFQIELLATHPMSAARAERLKAEAAALPKQEIVPFNFDWQAVQAAL